MYHVPFSLSKQTNANRSQVTSALFFRSITLILITNVVKPEDIYLLELREHQ